MTLEYSTPAATALLASARASAEARRRVLLDGMRELGDRGIGCRDCTGLCCTFVANSMQITPLEAADILADLTSRQELTPERLAHWEQTVRQHGLDRPAPGDGRRELVRRRYTCPFFAGGALGCTLKAEVKPYGCLAFNARSAGVREGEDCGVDGALLNARDAADGESSAVPLDGPKLPIPAALLALHARLSSQA